MKFAIFCCLLAFCAFEKVHTADRSSDVENAIIKSETDTSDYAERKRKTITVIAFAKQKPNCLDTFEVALSPIQTRAKDSFIKCSADARKSKEVEVAQKCCGEIYETLKTDVDKIVSQATKCLWPNSNVNENARTQNPAVDGENLNNDAYL